MELNDLSFADMLVVVRWPNAGMLGKIVVAENFIFVFDVLVTVTQFSDQFVNDKYFL